MIISIGLEISSLRRLCRASIFFVSKIPPQNKKLYLNNYRLGEMLSESLNHPPLHRHVGNILCLSCTVYSAQCTVHNYNDIDGLKYCFYNYVINTAINNQIQYFAVSKCKSVIGPILLISRSQIAKSTKHLHYSPSWRSGRYSNTILY